MYLTEATYELSMAEFHVKNLNLNLIYNITSQFERKK